MRFTGAQVHRFTGSRVHGFRGSQVHGFEVRGFKVLGLES
jgi:hypothetical protein